MRRLLLPSLFLLLPTAIPMAPLFAQAPTPLPEPILAEAPATATDLAATPATEPKPATPEDPASPLTPTSAPATAAPTTAPTKLSYSSCNVEGQIVAMTFDDGPHAQNTPRLLDILKQRNIKATFFVVGQNAAEYPDILKRIVAEGHELDNHSYSHPILASLGEAALRDQLEKTHQAVLNATGVTMKVMRPPYGALSEPQRRWSNANYGYRTILWDVDPLDWKYRDAGRVENEILGHTKSGSIILSHDIHKSTVDAMPTTLDALTAKGFKFVTVSELLALDRPSAPKPSATPKPVAKTASKPAPSTEAKPAPKSTAAKEEPAPRKKVADASDSKDSKPSAAASKSAANVPSKSDNAKGDSAPKQLSQEELRKKWLQSMNQR